MGGIKSRNTAIGAGTANVRRVSESLCDAVFDNQVDEELQIYMNREADACLQANEHLMETESDDAFEVALRRVNFSVTTEMTHLPAKRTFLARLSDEADPENGLYCDRAVHIQSGQTKRFLSERSLRGFLTTILLEELRQDLSEDNDKGYLL
jgi:hypothetical protein